MIKINLFNTFNNSKSHTVENFNGSVVNSVFDLKAPKNIDEDLSEKLKNNPTNNVDTKWMHKYKSYIPKNVKKYKKVYEFVKNYAEKQGNNTANIKEITNMICKLSDSYQIDPEITATILAKETGGFVFTEKVLSRRKNYKGVGQVDRDVVDCLYADTDYKFNKKYPSKRDESLSYDTRHWKQDKARIEQIKKKYPTSKALWEAIQKDVPLGLEIGIIAFKMKLHMENGDTVKALGKYCANQYSLPSNSTAKKKYNMPLPEYKFIF